MTSRSRSWSRLLLNYAMAWGPVGTFGIINHDQCQGTAVSKKWFSYFFLSGWLAGTFALRHVFLNWRGGWYWQGERYMVLKWLLEHLHENQKKKMLPFECQEELKRRRMGQKKEVSVRQLIYKTQFYFCKSGSFNKIICYCYWLPKCRFLFLFQI